MITSGRLSLKTYETGFLESASLQFGECQVKYDLCVKDLIKYSTNAASYISQGLPVDVKSTK